MFPESLELIKGRKQFHTAPQLRFDKFHHNKRIALKLQRCILGSCAYLCSFSWVPDPILSRRKSLLNTKLAFPGMCFHLKCTHESLRAAFRRNGKLFLFRLLTDLQPFETLCSISIQTLKCCRCHYYAERADVIIMLSVENTV